MTNFTRTALSFKAGELPLHYQLPSIARYCDHRSLADVLRFCCARPILSSLEAEEQFGFCPGISGGHPDHKPFEFIAAGEIGRGYPPIPATQGQPQL